MRGARGHRGQVNQLDNGQVCWTRLTGTVTDFEQLP